MKTEVKNAFKKTQRRKLESWTESVRFKKPRQKCWSSSQKHTLFCCCLPRQWWFEPRRPQRLAQGFSTPGVSTRITRCFSCSVVLTTFARYLLNCFVDPCRRCCSVSCRCAANNSSSVAAWRLMMSLTSGCRRRLSMLPASLLLPYWWLHWLPRGSLLWRQRWRWWFVVWEVNVAIHAAADRLNGSCFCCLADELGASAALRLCRLHAWRLQLWTAESGRCFRSRIFRTFVAQKILM